MFLRPRANAVLAIKKPKQRLFLVGIYQGLISQVGNFNYSGKQLGTTLNGFVIAKVK